jgi:hypothetical protein
MRIPTARLAVLALLAAAPLSAQNLLTNPRFDGSLLGWTTEAAVAAVHSTARDYGDNAASGSALISNAQGAADTAGGVSQCVAVTAGIRYHLSTRFLIPAGQARAARAQVHIAPFSSPGCVTSVSGFVSNGTPAITTFDRWGSIRVSTTIASGVASVRVTARLVKVEAGGTVQGYFDEVAFGPEAILTVPASASIHGQNGAFFHTDLWLLNTSSIDGFVVAQQRCFAGQSCPTTSLTIPLDRRVPKLYSDVVGTLFNHPETAGAIELTYPSAETKVVALSRTYSPSLPSPTTGSGIPALRSSEARTRAVLVGLGGSGASLATGFRSNVGAYNPGTSAVNVTFTLFGSSGAQLGSPVTRTLAANQPVQVNNIFAEAGAGSTVTTNAWVVVTSSAPVFSYATVIDNQSQDSVFVAAAEDVP